jgi:hypothetical protein
LKGGTLEGSRRGSVIRVMRLRDHVGVTRCDGAGFEYAMVLNCRSSDYQEKVVIPLDR